MPLPSHPLQLLLQALPSFFCSPLQCVLSCHAPASCSFFEISDFSISICFDVSNKEDTHETRRNTRITLSPARLVKEIKENNEPRLWHVLWVNCFYPQQAFDTLPCGSLEVICQQQRTKGGERCYCYHPQSRCMSQNDKPCTRWLLGCMDGWGTLHSARNFLRVLTPNFNITFYFSDRNLPA